MVHPLKGVAALRAWIRRAEAGLLLLAVGAGVVAGLLTALMGGVVDWVHVTIFGAGAERGLSAIWRTDPLVLLLVPAAGGLLLAGINRIVARIHPRSRIDPIKANALHGGRMSLRDAAVVAT